MLDERAFVGYQAKEANYEPLPLGKEPGGAVILKSLVRVDFLARSSTSMTRMPVALIAQRACRGA